MRISRALIVLAVGAVPFAAQAADAPAVGALDIAIANAAHDWTGAYAGFNVGYTWGEFETLGPAANAEDSLFNGNGALGGFQIGYNKQLGSLVIGFEGDVQAADIESSDGVTTTTLDWFSTARGRVGYAFDSTFIYGTAGLSVSGLTVEVPGTDGGRDDHALLGFVAGAGVEQALTDKISLKAEYLYVDTQNKTFDTGASSTNAEWDGHVVRFGANLKF